MKLNSPGLNDKALSKVRGFRGIVGYGSHKDTEDIEAAGQARLTQRIFIKRFRL